MAHLRTIRLISIAVIMGAVLSSCSSGSSEDVAKLHRDRARSFLEKQQYDEALASFRELLKADPRDDEAFYQTALLYLRSGKPEDVDLAHQALLKVVKLKGSRTDAHVQLARLYLLAGESAKAGLQADAILAIDPAHSNGHLIKGLSLASEGRRQSGIAELRKAIELDSTNQAAYLELAKVYAQQRNFGEAEVLLRERMGAEPHIVDTRIALGDILAAAGKDDEAIEVYRQGLEMDRNNGLLYVRLAMLKQKMHRMDEAERHYREWIEAQPNNPQAFVSLAQFYSTTGRLKDADTSYQRARQIDPLSRFTQEAIIEFYLDSKRAKEARYEIEALLKPNPTDVAGRILHARLLMEEGDAEKALPLLQDLTREAPKLAIIHQYLGVAWARRRDFPQAISAFKQAKVLAPDSGEIRASLAQAYLAQDSLSLALREGETAVQLNPHNVFALKILADAHLLAGDMKRAEEMLKEALALQPQDALIHYRLGGILRDRRPVEALAHFEQALERNPQSLENLEQVVAILVSQNRMPDARQRVVRHISATPQDPKLHNLLGRVLMQGRHFSEAEATFKRAMALDKALLVTYVNLGELYARQGKIKQAVEELERVVLENPRQPAVLMLLGMLHEQQKDVPRAMARYEEALQISAGFAPAANNLAWLLLEHAGDKERALQYAEMAWKAFPTDPYIADTLGWIYFKKEMYPKAVTLLKNAVDNLPEHPTILFHYGMAQYWNDNNAEAKKSLTKFLALSPDNMDAGKAKKVLAAL
jgi:putative PEP-CTERM system TPR-repeat lipoprotein